MCALSFSVEETNPLAAFQGLLSFIPTVEVECPWCTWEFTVDFEGRVEDDGGLDLDPLFEIDDDGEWTPADLFVITCPHCGQHLETDAPEVSRCPHCCHSCLVDGEGRAHPEKVNPFEQPECPHCHVALHFCADRCELYCSSCGRVFDWDDDED